MLAGLRGDAPVMRSRACIPAFGGIGLLECFCHDLTPFFLPSCFVRKSCNADKSDIRLASCKHCGATNWNILGDSDTGYVLSEGDGKYCLMREKGSKKAKMVLCEKDGYTALHLQFANRDDIKAMSSVGARLITAASDGDKKLIKSYLKNKVDVNSRDWDQLTALIAAASAGHLDIVKLLLDAGTVLSCEALSFFPLSSSLLPFLFGMYASPCTHAPFVSKPPGRCGRECQGQG